ncbi:MAG: hypothetical protein CYPHOPRED_003171 [Cyphobasidiales sp. Tagirdzhanova-0007]|nr:MAG: hypothetical protein CYPHOPRED_003171 [Cyphobasidiales sp. Tagirdzhanova-0007]
MAKPMYEEDEGTELSALVGPSQSDDGQKLESFPWRQILPLCFARSMESFMYWLIFPYVPAMVERTGVIQKNLGYWCGAIESIYSVTQVGAMLAWSRIGNRAGPETNRP